VILRYRYNCPFTGNKFSYDNNELDKKCLSCRAVFKVNPIIIAGQ